MCCLFGFIDYNHNLSGKQKNRLLRSLASAAEERGTDAAGIAYHAGGKLHIMKKAKPAHVLRFRVPAETSVVMGHTRYATQGDTKKAYNAHPFQGQIGNKKFALAHNMELCHEAVLYQIDLLNGSANRVTECEYWAKKKGQAALDRENATLATEGKPTQPTRFETDKEKLRQIIRKTLNESFTVEDFARKLGDSFDKAAVLAALEQNALRSEHTLTSSDGIPLDRTLSSNEGASDRHTPKQSAPQTPSIGRMVDREAKRTEGKGIGYDRWASMQLPKRKDVVAEIQSLISEKNECYNDYREKSDRLHELMTMQRNYQIEMQPQRPKHGRKHEQEL